MSLGRAGIAGNVGFGSSGKWGKAGSSGFGNSGKFGISGFGNSGISGNGGSSTLGNGGSSGISGNVVSSRLRASAQIDRVMMRKSIIVRDAEEKYAIIFSQMRIRVVPS